MSYFIVLLFMLILGVDLAYLFKRGFGQTAAIANFILIFMLYIGGLVLNMRIEMCAFFAVVILLTVYVGVKVAKGGAVALNGVKTIISSPSFYIYALLGVALGVIFLNRVSEFTDEFSHWALVSKNMFLNDNFGNVGDVTTMFNQYVPATGIFMYAFQFFNSEFSNGTLYSAFNLLLLSLLLPILDRFDKKLTPTAILFTVLTLALPVAFKASVYVTLMVDPLLGIMCAYLYLTYSLNKGKTDGFTILGIALACFVLTLVKSTGIVFAAFAMIFIVIDVLTRGRREAKAFFKRKRNFVYILLPVVLIVFAKLSWSWYIDFYNVRAGWDASELNLQNVLGWIGNPTPYQQTVTANFFKTFFVGAIRYDGGLQVPQVLMLLLFAGACVGLGFKTRNKAFAITQGVVMWVVIIGYGVSLLLMYLFSFAYKEGLALASYPRYMTSVMIALSLILLYQYAELFGVKWSEKNHIANEKRKGVKKLTNVKVAAGAAVLAFVFAITGYFVATDQRDRVYAPYTAWQSCIATLDANKDSVYIVVSDKDIEAQSQIYIRMRFYSTPMQASGYLEGGSYADGRGAKICWTGNPFSMSLSVEELSAEMSKYTHVYLHDVWDEFEDKYGVLFESPIEDDTLYEITYDGETMKLVKVEK